MVKVTVSDRYGAAVAGATVRGSQGTYSTDAQGVALVLAAAPDASADVTVSHATFVDKTIVAASAAGQVNEVPITLDRATSPAGGSLASRSGTAPAVDSTGQQINFEIELAVVDGDSRAIEGLSQSSFVLRPCTPDPANDRADCVLGAGTDADRAYTPTGSMPETSVPVAGLAARPYATALLLDQSSSIAAADPTGARLYSTKAFLGGLGGADLALLSAFAGNPGAKIPTSPLTVYAPFRDQASASSYFSTVDSLATVMGGNTPLYASLDALLAQLAGDSSPPAGVAKAVVIFTDGADTSCGSPQACLASREQSIQRANQDQVRLFTIGLSNGVDAAALGQLANQTGGALLYADNIQQLLPLYGSVGKLLSLSLPTYRLRWTAQAGAPGAFRSGDTLLGRVQVTAGNSTFDVPFIVGIP